MCDGVTYSITHLLTSWRRAERTGKQEPIHLHHPKPCLHSHHDGLSEKTPLTPPTSPFLNLNPGRERRPPCRLLINLRDPSIHPSSARKEDLHPPSYS
ncbi:hypothetical protein JTE90_016696 [Oedothorax gibbosus]|uniref:Uncharacterized protein n=1 Tax=Oedothorax gibbosus TaxID=931172 RepID=A0AAV6V2Y6_9ARAC|nr:hypothetical protein JTE90_016696 [Oedothorax gibbosus]